MPNVVLQMKLGMGIRKREMGRRRLRQCTTTSWWWLHRLPRICRRGNEYSRTSSACLRKRTKAYSKRMWANHLVMQLHLRQFHHPCTLCPSPLGIQCHHQFNLHHTVKRELPRFLWIFPRSAIWLECSINGTLQPPGQAVCYFVSPRLRSLSEERQSPSTLVAPNLHNVVEQKSPLWTHEMCSQCHFRQRLWTPDSYPIIILILNNWQLVSSFFTAVEELLHPVFEFAAWSFLKLGANVGLPSKNPTRECGHRKWGNF